MNKILTLISQIQEKKIENGKKEKEKKLETQKIGDQDQAKLSKLQITQFNGIATDWVLFENMLITQVDKKQISDEVKFGYLLEMV